MIRSLFGNPYLLLTISMALWGGNAVAGRAAAGLIPPYTLSCYRWVLACAVVSVIAYPHLKTDFPVLLRNWHKVMAFGAAGFGAFTMLLYWGLQHTSATNASLEQSLAPAFTMLLAFLILKDRVNLYQMAGVAISIMGVAVIASNGSLDALLRGDINVGDVAIIFAAVSYSLYAVFLAYRPVVHTLSLFFAMSFVAAVMSLPFSIYELMNGAEIIVNTRSTIAFFYAALLPATVAQITFMRAVAIVGANRATVMINLIPLFGVVFSVLILDEALETYHIVGGALALAGISLAEAMRNRKKS